MNIIISGLTAAGKTTHCKLLAEKFHLTYISATAALAKVGNVAFSDDSTNSKFWISKEASLLNKRRKQDTTIDLAVDAQLIDFSMTLDQAVFDAWGLPWFSSAPALRIWLESSFESRLLKALVSHRHNQAIKEEFLRSLLKRKDQEARDYFLRLYSFDIFKDRSVFDIVIDISHFIRKPHILSAKKGIALTDEILSNIVGWYLHNDVKCKQNLQSCLTRYGNDVFLSCRSSLKTEGQLESLTQGNFP